MKLKVPISKPVPMTLSWIVLILLSLQMALAQSFTMTNDTHPQSGTPNFVVGDHYTATITGGQPNQPVTVTMYQNGNLLATNYPIGTTDSAGNWQFGNTESSGTVGIWTETWYVGSAQVANISLFVLSQLPSAQQKNTSNSALNFSTGADFVKGDGYEADISSGTPAANQPVTLSGTLNNVSFGPVALGTTDSNGNLTLTGTQGQSVLGDWTEQWYVGGLPAAQSLEFEVIDTPTSLQFKGVSVLPSPPTTAGCPSPYLGVWGDIQYQIVSNSGTYDTSVPMEPWEDIKYPPPGGPTSNAVGPVPGYSDSTEYAETDGTFHDVPFGWCSLVNTPPSLSIPSQYQATQTLSVYIGNAEYQVRVNTWYDSSSGRGHGTDTNNNDVSFSR